MDHLIKVFDGDPVAALWVFLALVAAMVLGFAIAVTIVCAPPLTFRRKPRASDDGVHGDVVIVPRAERRQS